MDTKLKVKKFSIWHWSTKLIIFLVMTASLITLHQCFLHVKDINYFLTSDEALIDNATTPYQLESNISMVHSGVSSKDEVEEAQKNIDYYINQGYRYFILDANYRVSAYDNQEPYYDNYQDIMDNYKFDILADNQMNNSNIQEDTFKGKKIVIVATQQLRDSILNDYSKVRDIGGTYFYLLICSALSFVICLVLVCILSGKNSKISAVQIKFYDKIYSDILISIYIFSILLLMISSYQLFYYKNYLIDNIYVLLIYGMIITLSTLTFWVFTSISKRVKMGGFFKYTLIYRILTLVKKVVLYPIKAIMNKTVKLNIIIYSAIFLILTSGSLIFGFAFLFGYGTVLLGFAILCIPLPLFIFLYAKLISKELNGFSILKKAVHEIKNGNLTHKVAYTNNKEVDAVVYDINNISDGLQAAVKTAVISEKMKTELITNVSHDLKTPLTSIISYIELLSEETNLSPQAKDYIIVLQKKSEGLKNIISDLFELSKGTSGNIDVNIEQLDLKRLIEQTLGDMDDRICQQKIIIKTNLPHDEVAIFADGKRLYRVFQNLIDNALKYSLEGSRIYIKLKVEESIAIAEVLNTSSYEMNFTEDEVIERFSRADSARSTEGSGLGLSIAKTFTEICGGVLTVKIDGDLFKVIVTFPLA